MSTVDRCTCYQELTRHFGDSFARFRITEKDESCPEHGEVEQILATGRYTDRRGREWEYSDNPGLNEWFADIPGDPLERGWWCSPKEMRLLIERDQHRDECRGIGTCSRHPVTHVSVDIFDGGYLVSTYRNEYGGRYDSLPAAMSAARALAVGK